MHTRYIPHVPALPGAVCLHNTAHWQVTELMGGLACELLRKTRNIDDFSRRSGKLSLHDCYPSLLMQGDEAGEFMAELAAARKKLSAQAVDALMLDAYSVTLN